MRATTLLNRVLDLAGVRVIDVDPGSDAADPFLVRVELKARKRLDCPLCKFSTMAGYDTRWAESRWRHLDVAGRMTVLSMLRRRLRCPAHGVVVQGVPFARPGSRFTTCFEDIIAWLVTRADKTSKTTVSTFARIAWRTVGAICERVVAEQLDATRFEGLVNIGVDEISWRKHHRHLTLVSDHATKEDRVGRPGEERRDTGWVLYRDRPGEHGVDWGCQHGPLRDKLVAAILAGRKTTTTSLLAEFAVDDEPLPRISRYQQVIDSSGRPAAIFETVAVGQLPLGRVPLTQAMDEGEGYSSVAQ